MKGIIMIMEAGGEERASCASRLMKEAMRVAGSRLGFFRKSEAICQPTS